MPDGTIRADAPKIEHAVSVFRDAGDLVGDVDFPHVTADVAGAMPGGSAIEQALDRACGAAAVAAARGSDRLAGLVDFAAEAHRFLEATDENFAALLAAVAKR